MKKSGLSPDFVLHCIRNVETESAQRKQFHRLFKLHPGSLVLAAVLVAGAILYKKFFSPYPAGFPGYFLFIALTALVPSSALLPSARSVIKLARLQPRNLLRPPRQHPVGGHLAIRYDRWNYRDEQMLGVSITAWGGLPIEAVRLWIAVTYSTVIIYETVKCWEASGKSIRHALFGEPFDSV